MHSRAVARTARTIHKQGRALVLISSSANGPAYDPRPIRTERAAMGLQSSGRRHDQSGQLLQRLEAVFLISSDFPITTDMSLRDGEDQYTITAVERLRKGPALLYYRVTAQV